MNIRFSDHAESRLKLRKISKKSVVMVLENSLNQYYDLATRNLIAIGRAKYGGRSRLLMISFQEIFGETIVITAHPISNVQIQNRTLKGRWIKI